MAFWPSALFLLVVGDLSQFAGMAEKGLIEPFTQLLAGILLDVRIGVDQQIGTGVACCALHSFHITAGDHQLIGGTGMPQAMEHDAGELRMLPPTRRTRNNACWEIPTPSNLHRPGAGCAMESLNSTKAYCSPDVKNGKADKIHFAILKKALLLNTLH